MMRPELKPHAPPCPSQWNISKAQMWLIDNPVTNAEDRAFIFSAIEETIATGARATLERSSMMDLFNKKWPGKEPILRLIHTLVDNNSIKHTYLQHFDFPLNRMVIENHNTAESRAACCWMMMADKWDDPTFCPAQLL
jgi:hypothetical protein